MTLIYRVEANDNLGPYRGDIDELEPMLWSHVDDAHPSPRRDAGLGHILEAEYFGFIREEQLHEWFQGYEEALADEGFYMSVYDVPDEEVRVGEAQVVFHREHALLISRTEL